jgi:hypothetical protein
MVLGGLFVGRVRGITANVLTLRWTNSILARDQLNPYLRSTQGLCRCFDLDATPQEAMIFHSAGQAFGGWRVLAFRFAGRVRPPRPGGARNLQRFG